MNAKSILIPASALLAGSIAGWFTGEEPRTAGTPAAKPPQVAQAPADKAAAPAAKLPARKKCFDELYKHLVWLESATAAEVAQELWAPSVHDSTQRSLNMCRFLQFPARVRLTALLSIKEGTPRTWSGDEMGWLTPIAAEMIATAPEDVARLLSAARLSSETDGILDKLFAQQGYDGCLAFLSKLPEKDQQRLRGAAAGLLAKQDLARAQAESLKVPEGVARNEMVSAVAQVWAESDSRAALAWATQHGREKDSHHGGASTHPARSLLADLLLKDAKLGGALLLENQGLYGGSYGPYTLGQTFESWARMDYQGAADWLAANPLGDDLQATAERSISSARLGSLKGAEALQFFQSLPDDLKGDCFEALVKAVGVDGLPGGIFNFSEALPESERLSFLSSLRYGQTNLTPEQIKSILPMVAKLDTYGHVTKDFIGKLPEADLAAMQSLLPAKLQAEVSIKAAENALNAGDLETAKTLLSAAEGRETLYHAQLAIELAQDNPDDATAWIDSLRDGRAKEDAITNLAANWAKAHLAAASAWVEKLPPGNARDAAVTEITRLQGLSGDTTAALALAASVKSESDRLTAFANAARQAWFQDPDASTAALSARGLSAEQQQKVITKIQTGSTR